MQISSPQVAGQAPAAVAAAPAVTTPVALAAANAAPGDAAAEQTSLQKNSTVQSVLGAAEIKRGVFYSFLLRNRTTSHNQ